MTTLAETERAKYERTWAQPAYRAACHGLALWRGRRELFPERVGTAVDLGCGTGRLVAAWLAEGIDAYGVDITPDALDRSILEHHRDRFEFTPLWQWEPGRHYDFGCCTDVMEHIPPGRVRVTLGAIGAACDEVLFKIAHVPDVMGGGELHLTVEPPEWWLFEIGAVGGDVELVGTQERSGFQDSLIRWRPAR